MQSYSHCLLGMPSVLQAASAISFAGALAADLEAETVIEKPVFCTYCTTQLIQSKWQSSLNLKTLSY